MGDIADMILDGTLDSTTGEYLGSPCGYPRAMYTKRARYIKKVKCRICGRLIHPDGFVQHNKDKHNNKGVS